MFAPKYPLQPEEAQVTCVKQSSCVMSFSLTKEAVHILENLWSKTQPEVSYSYVHQVGLVLEFSL